MNKFILNQKLKTQEVIKLFRFLLKCLLTDLFNIQLNIMCWPYVAIILNLINDRTKSKKIKINKIIKSKSINRYKILY